jgi:hypothetical protein
VRRPNPVFVASRRFADMNAPDVDVRRNAS